MEIQEEILSYRRWRAGNLSYDERSNSLSLNETPLFLDRTAQAILIALLRANGAPVSKDNLLEAGWPGRLVHENSLAKAVGRVRSTLGEEGHRVEAVYGQGYRLVSGEPVETELSDDVAEPLAVPVVRPDWLQRLSCKRVRAVLAIGTVVVAAATGAVIYSASHARAGDEQVEQLVSFLSADLLEPADPYSPRRDSKSLRVVVEKTAATMNERFKDQPDTLISLNRVIANAFSGWGEYQKAIFHLDAAAALEQSTNGTSTEAYAQVEASLCQALRLAGHTGRARIACHSAVEIDSRLHFPDLAHAQVTQAKLFFETGQYERAATELDAVLNISGPIDPSVEADANWFLGLSLRKLARFDQADAAFRRHIQLREKQVGSDHPLTAWALADYGDFLVDRGDFARAEANLLKARAIFVETLGKDHPESLSPQYSLGVLRLWEGRPADARTLLVPVLKHYRKELGSDHFWTLYAMTELALADAQLGDRTEAARLLDEARQIGIRTLYGLDAKASHFHLRWARTFLALGEADPAEQEIQAARDTISRSFAPAHPWQARVHCLSAHLFALRQSRSLEQREAARCESGLRAAGVPPSYALWREVEAFRKNSG
ncbi:tetratricopeptide repeat protein [Novosphingobium mangrovi (ex Huang et al. 2023)]|uniref:Tetratricopeptide repeat protein n=2 Tax=Novosphingobium TaxID=165696 RepID=A0ABT2I1H6_9SPHN|nr:tetratricopeptide repeat protein [Novosphingobium mangrovi (ex Huang et al. 2023)]MCT2398662.1 tetratricopeptide repeat protein [Novosphingobium mangrovi (ex Huang et al. 2023)]